MTKNLSLPDAYNISVDGATVSTRISPENPIRQLKEFEKKWTIEYPQITNFREEYQWRVESLFGTHHIANSIRILWRISKDTFTYEFNKRIIAILWDHRIHLDWLYITSRRPREWALEVDWHTHDFPTTRHHLIPQERWWEDHERNYLILPEEHHKDLHKVLWNLTPIEQIAHLVLCFREYYDPRFIRDVCGIVQDQNAQYESFLLEYGKVKYPPGIYNFIQKWN